MYDIAGQKHHKSNNMRTLIRDNNIHILHQPVQAFGVRIYKCGRYGKYNVSGHNDDVLEYHRCTWGYFSWRQKIVQ